MMLERNHLSEIVCREAGIWTAPRADLSEWEAMLERMEQSIKPVTIALVGKYVKLHDAYLSVAEALQPRRL